MSTVTGFNGFNFRFLDTQPHSGDSTAENNDSEPRFDDVRGKFSQSPNTPFSKANAQARDNALTSYAASGDPNGAFKDSNSNLKDELGFWLGEYEKFRSGEYGGKRFDALSAFAQCWQGIDVVDRGYTDGQRKVLKDVLPNLLLNLYPGDAASENDSNATPFAMGMPD